MFEVISSIGEYVLDCLASWLSNLNFFWWVVNEIYENSAYREA